MLGQWIGPAISGFTHYGLLTGFFTLIYKWLPTGGVPWRFALVGGAVARCCSRPATGRWSITSR